MLPTQGDVSAAANPGGTDMGDDSSLEMVEGVNLRNEEFRLSHLIVRDGSSMERTNAEETEEGFAQHFSMLSKYQCPSCGKVFQRDQSLKVHMESVHLNIRYTCNVCTAVFTQPGSLRRHVESVHERRSYNCDLCNKVFNRKDLYQQHKRWHLNTT